MSDDAERAEAFVTIDGRPEFRVSYKVHSTVIFEAEVHEVCGWTEEDGELKADELQPYLTAVIKWDSCSHLTIAQNGYLHLCGVADFKKHIALLRWLYQRAFLVMKRDPQPDEVWEKDT